MNINQPEHRRSETAQLTSHHLAPCSSRPHDVCAPSIVVRPGMSRPLPTAWWNTAENEHSRNGWQHMYINPLVSGVKMFGRDLYLRCVNKPKNGRKSWFDLHKWGTITTKRNLTGWSPALITLVTRLKQSTSIYFLDWRKPSGRSCTTLRLLRFHASSQLSSVHLCLFY